MATIRSTLLKATCLTLWLQVRTYRKKHPKLIQTASEIAAVFPVDDEYFAYFDDTSAKSCMQALDDLEAYIAAEGPYDAVLAFSQGVSLAITYLLRKQAEDPQFRIRPPFKCGVFIAGLPPVDYDVLKQGEIKFLDCDAHAESLKIPTTNIWGVNDTLWGHLSIEVNKLGEGSLKSVVMHNGGHEVPGFKMKDALAKAVECVRNTIEITPLLQ